MVRGGTGWGGQGQARGAIEYWKAKLLGDALLYFRFVKTASQSTCGLGLTKSTQLRTPRSCVTNL